MAFWEDLIKSLSDSQGASPFGQVATNLAQAQIEDEKNRASSFVGSPLKERPWDVPSIKDMLSKLNGNTELSPMATGESSKVSLGLKASGQTNPSQPSIKTPAELPTTLPKAPTTDEEMRKVLEEYKNRVSGANFRRDMDKAVEQAYGHLGLKADEEGHKERLKQAGMPVELLTKQREADKALQEQNKAAEYGSPTSRRSQVSRDMARSYLNLAGLTDMSSKITDDMSAEQVDSLTKGIFKDAVDQQMDMKRLQESVLARKEMKEEANLLRKEEKREKEKSKVDESTYRYNILNQNLDKLDKLISDEGTNVMFGAEGEKMDKIIYEAAIDFAKLVDPDSVAREGEVAAAQKYMLPIRNNMGLGMSNATARTLIEDYKKDLNDRMQARTSAKGAAIRPFEPAKSSGPQAGTIEDGHEFLGGDPSDPNNWKEVK